MSIISLRNYLSDISVPPQSRHHRPDPLGIIGLVTAELIQKRVGVVEVILFSIVLHVKIAFRHRMRVTSTF